MLNTVAVLRKTQRVPFSPLLVGWSCCQDKVQGCQDQKVYSLLSLLSMPKIRTSSEKCPLQIRITTFGVRQPMCTKTFAFHASHHFSRKPSHFLPFNVSFSSHHLSPKNTFKYCTKIRHTKFIICT